MLWYLGYRMCLLLMLSPWAAFGNIVSLTGVLEPVSHLGSSSVQRECNTTAHMPTCLSHVPEATNGSRISV